MLRKSGDGKRGAHGMSTALLKGELVVADGLPPELAQELFATSARCDALTRLSQGPSGDLSDKASGQRGLSIKVLGVDGPHVAGSGETTTQDWVLGVRDTAFTDATAQQLLRTFRYVGAKSTYVPEAAIIAGSRVARDVEAALEAVGPGSAHLRFFGKTPVHLASDSYHSQAPVPYGDFIAQVSAVLDAATLDAIGDPALDTSDDDVFRHAMEAIFAAGRGVRHPRPALHGLAGDARRGRDRCLAGGAKPAPHGRPARPAASDRVHRAAAALHGRAAGVQPHPRAQGAPAAGLDQSGADARLCRDAGFPPTVGRRRTRRTA